MICGVIHQPYFKSNTGYLGRTIWGVKGIGTDVFKPIRPPMDRFIVTTTRSHSNALVQATLDVLNPDEVLRLGGATPALRKQCWMFTGC